MAANGNPVTHAEHKPVLGATDRPRRNLSMAQVKEGGRAWFEKHNGAACVAIACAFCAVVLGIFLFVAFSDFGGSADFIYNQF